MPIHFYDSASPQNIPSGVYAAAYVNGYVWPEREVMRMAKVIRVSVLADPHWARQARCIDVERGAASPEQAVAFVKLRRAYGFNDATVYVNRGNWEAVRNAHQQANEPHPFYWVATLDGTMDVPGAWAVQYADRGRYDLSVLHGIDNFHTP